jgi:thiamine biosynthesis protein ThiS
MRLIINGQERELSEALSLASLIDQLGIKSDRVAVELNLDIIPKSNWSSTTLKDGDKLEIVHFVGGGGSID